MPPLIPAGWENMSEISWSTPGAMPTPPLPPAAWIEPRPQPPPPPPLPPEPESAAPPLSRADLPQPPPPPAAEGMLDDEAGAE